MSLPEILLLLERAGHRDAVELLAATRSRCLASAAKWSKKAGEALDKFVAQLAEHVEPGSSAPKKATRAQVMQLFSLLGIPQQKAA